MRDENGKSVWFYVALGNCLETARRLKLAEANAQSYMEHSPLIEAVRNGNIEIVKILFEMKGTDVREVTGDNQNSTLHVAAANGHNDIVSLLVENGVNIHARNIR